jgi:hypothetical protein
MSGAIPLLPQYAHMAWTGTHLPFYEYFPFSFNVWRGRSTAVSVLYGRATVPDLGNFVDI